jgi:Protein of unknown function (DUF1553)/Protein of unknown function (DUF1549)/Planctomycete cytochrome C
MRIWGQGKVCAATATALLSLALPRSPAADDRKTERTTKPFTAEQVRFFENEVQSILKEHCLKCHGGGPKVKANFRVDSREALLRGGDLGPAVSLTKPAESRLLQAIRYEELEMPPAGKLPAHEIEVLTKWVSDGIPWSAVANTASTARPAAATTHKPAANNWSLRPVVRPVVPRVKQPDWCSNPIDAFILARLEAENLAPASPADRVTLIRRLQYDLTGLPPTPEEIDAFVADRSLDAYERLVDRLLGSSQYGEKWGRHWLDLVRYGETNGYERDSAKPYAWRYRDYVIDAFNRDKGFDQFIREQLAGDELEPDGAEALIATGYYRLGIWDDEPADRPLAHYDGLDGIISTTGQVILGMSINCARCHDHKIDPIPQRDYYRLLAFFQSIREPDAKNLKKVSDAQGNQVQVMCVAERASAPTHVLLRGNPNLEGDKVEPGVPEILSTGAPKFENGPGKRRALADWLTRRENPRTARVLANRVWQYHFGCGIVPTPNDFGGLGEAATHPELLDWLAAELMDGGWRLKRMHRLIVLSSAYRMASLGRTTELAADPSNKWYWRFPMRRLTAEEVRDSVLAVSGTLNPKAGGPSVFPPIPKEVMAGQSVPGQGWSTSPPAEAARRSVYVHVKRSLLVPIMATHDAADTDFSCPVRYTTTVPTQALGLLNGAFCNEQARFFADRLARDASDDLAEKVRRAIRLTTGREPDAGEVKGDVDFINRLINDEHLSAHDALKQYCLLALNANAFLYLD